MVASLLWHFFSQSEAFLILKRDVSGKKNSSLNVGFYVQILYLRDVFIYFHCGVNSWLFGYIYSLGKIVTNRNSAENIFALLAEGWSGVKGVSHISNSCKSWWHLPTSIRQVLMSASSVKEAICFVLMLWWSRAGRDELWIMTLWAQTSNATPPSVGSLLPHSETALLRLGAPSIRTPPEKDRDWILIIVKSVWCYGEIKNISNKVCLVGKKQVKIKNRTRKSNLRHWPTLICSVALVHEGLQSIPPSLDFNSIQSSLFI